MSALSTPQESTRQGAAAPLRVALLGNPNSGKTTLFNALTGLRAKTANYPGITVDLRTGPLRIPGAEAELIDLPGLYSLDALSPEEEVAEALLRGELDGGPPDLVLLVIDATNVQRNLFLAGEILELGLPTIIVLNLMDAADASGIRIEPARLAAELNCPVVPVSARSGRGLDALREAVAEGRGQGLPVLAGDPPSCGVGCSGCTFAARHEWAERLSAGAVEVPQTHGRRTAAIDRVLTNSVFGVLAFAAVMLGVFYLIFSLADVPMTLIDEGFGELAALAGSLLRAAPDAAAIRVPLLFALVLAVCGVGYQAARVRWTGRSGLLAASASAVLALLPADDFRSLVVDGVIAGVGGVVIFLPQICILFFFISLLEDSGYMARAAFVMERLMRRVGLPGKAFVPMLSAHACAIPGIMAARVIEDRRDRLVTILVLPLLTCSARLPVYTMIAALLFSGSPAQAALVFIGAYILGAAAALSTAFCLKHTILKGESAPLVMELPEYRLPSLRNALMTVVDRAAIFTRKAGSVILAISVILWALATYPKLPDQAASPHARAGAASPRADAGPADVRSADPATAEAEREMRQEALAHSFAGRLGRFVEPLFRPLGFDWKINVGVISSFAAREVVVSTLAIVYGMDEEAAEDEATLVETLRRQQHPDGTPVFTTATCLSLLVFYVLAMQCLPTQAVTRRETGAWKWALFQLGYMTVLAYTAALVVYQVSTAAGLA